MLKNYIFNYYGYYILFFILLICSIFNKKKLYLFFSWICSFFIIFRFDTSYDYVWYWIIGDNRFKEYWFYEAGYRNLELFYKFLYKIVRFLNNPKFFFILTGTIFSMIFFREIKRNNKNIFLSLNIYIYIYYIGFLIGFIRQGLAVVISMFLLKKLEEKKYIYFILGIILNALLIHKSSIICLVFFVIKIFKDKKINLNILYTIFIILFINLEIILTNVTFFNKYILYIKKHNMETLSKKIILGLFILFLIAEIINKNYKIKRDLYGELSIVGFILYFLSFKFYGGHLPQRISIYFLIYFPIYFSNSVINLKYYKVINLILMIIFYSYGNFSIFRDSKLPIIERSSSQFRLQFFNDYEDLNGKYIPGYKVDYKIKNK